MFTLTQTLTLTLTLTLTDPNLNPNPNPNSNIYQVKNPLTLKKGRGNGLKVLRNELPSLQVGYNDSVYITYT
jgi:hypothetical protein